MCGHRARSPLIDPTTDTHPHLSLLLPLMPFHISKSYYWASSIPSAWSATLECSVLMIETPASADSQGNTAQPWWLIFPINRLSGTLFIFVGSKLQCRQNCWWQRGIVDTACMAYGVRQCPRQGAPICIWVACPLSIWSGDTAGQSTHCWSCTWSIKSIKALGFQFIREKGFMNLQGNRFSRLDATYLHIFFFKVQAYMISTCNHNKPSLCAQSSGIEDEWKGDEQTNETNNPYISW